MTPLKQKLITAAPSAGLDRTFEHFSECRHSCKMQHRLKWAHYGHTPEISPSRTKIESASFRRTPDSVYMARHTAPKNRRIDDAYPIRIKVRVPPNGLGNMVGEIHVWMKNHMFPDRCKNLPVRAIHQQATAYHFRSLQDAQAFLDALPSLELADGVDSR